MTESLVAGSDRPAGVAQDLGAVAIGRTRGTGSSRCLESLVGRVARVVYVDSGSTDGSVEAARPRGVEVVALDLSTAVHGREGAERRARPPAGASARPCGSSSLSTAIARSSTAGSIGPGRSSKPGPTWPSSAGGVASGTPGRSIYNRLADLEWDTPDRRRRGLRRRRDDAGRGAPSRRRLRPDPDRRRGAGPLRPPAGLGWKIERLDAEMALHDWR